MSYEIKDTHHKIIIKLNTNSDVTGSLYLRTFVNGSTVAHNPLYTYSNNQFVIRASDYNVGDVITKFEIVQSGSPRLWNTHEGVQVLINGNEVNAPITELQNHNGEFTYDFGETGAYDIQAVYTGNGSNEMVRTEKKHFIITQETSSQQSGSSQSQTGKYVLDFKNKTTPKLKYNDGTVIPMVLTLNGQPVKDRPVQLVKGDRDIDETGTHLTNAKGIVNIRNNYISAGKQKIGGFYYDEINRRTIKKYRTVTIAKLSPTIKDNFVADKNGKDTNFVKGSKYVVTFKLNGEPLKNASIDMFVNGKKIPKTTDKNGRVAYAFSTKNTFKIKTVYKGTKNIDSAEITRSITISE